MLTRLFTLFVLLAALLGQPPRAYSAEVIRVAVASNFLLPMKVLAQHYYKQGGHRVKISSGSTGKLYAQIINGAPFDIFFAANSREPQRLETAGLCVSGSRSTYAVGRVALWSRNLDLVAKQPIRTLENGNYKRLVIANPATAPYGQAAVSILKALQLDNKLESKLMTAENISQTYRYIASGNVDLGFVAWSQLVAHKKEKEAWLVPEKHHPAIEQQSVLLQRATQNKAARDFLDYLKSAEASKLILSFGYGLKKNI